MLVAVLNTAPFQPALIDLETWSAQQFGDLDPGHYGVSYAAAGPGDSCFVAAGYRRVEDSWEGAVWIVDLPARTMVLQSSGVFSSPCWSHDGAYVAYVRRLGAAESTVWVASTRGGPTEEVGPGTAVCWVRSGLVVASDAAELRHFLFEDGAVIGESEDTFDCPPTRP
jgi:hypothetical protein